jgi:hypothetical protein
MSSEMLETFSEVWDALGEHQGIAGLTGAKASTVSMWKSAGSFPANTYIILTDALRAIGKTAPDSFWRMKVPAEGAS